jgi:transposase
VRREARRLAAADAAELLERHRWRLFWLLKRRFQVRREARRLAAADAAELLERHRWRLFWLLKRRFQVRREARRLAAADAAELLERHRWRLFWLLKRRFQVRREARRLAKVELDQRALRHAEELRLQGVHLTPESRIEVELVEVDRSLRHLTNLEGLGHMIQVEPSMILFQENGCVLYSRMTNGETNIQLCDKVCGQELPICHMTNRFITVGSYGRERVPVCRDLSQASRSCSCFPSPHTAWRCRDGSRFSALHWLR